MFQLFILKWFCHFKSHQGLLLAASRMPKSTWECRCCWGQRNSNTETRPSCMLNGMQRKGLRWVNLPLPWISLKFKNDPLHVINWSHANLEWKRGFQMFWSVKIWVYLQTIVLSSFYKPFRVMSLIAFFQGKIALGQEWVAGLECTSRSLSG